MGKLEQLINTIGEVIYTVTLPLINLFIAIVDRIITILEPYIKRLIEFINELRAEESSDDIFVQKKAPFIFKNRELVMGFARFSQKYFGKLVKDIEQKTGNFDDTLKKVGIPLNTSLYISFSVGFSLLMALFATSLVISLVSDPVVIIGAPMLVFGITLMFLTSFPKRLWQSKVSEMEKELPYAIRHIAMLIIAGASIQEAFVAVSQGKYKALSDEFADIIRDMQTGRTFEQAVQRFAKKTESETITRVMNQIVRSVQMGANLSDNLQKIADDLIFEQNLKLKEYTQKLNSLSFIITQITVVVPTMIVIMSFALSGLMRGFTIPPNVIQLMLIVIVPAITLMFVQTLKKQDPMGGGV